MAVAPVLERTQATQENQTFKGFAAFKNDDAHNAQISSIYAKLINPSAGIDEILGRRAEQQREECSDGGAVMPAVEPVQSRVEEVQRPYRVENARADSYIFRADNAVNRKFLNAQAAETETTETADEEENEDLRPTPTTIQYKTAGVRHEVENGKISNTGVQKQSLFTRREKIVIAVAVAVIVALFVLIIVNSAVISNLSQSMDVLQNSLADVKTQYEEINGAIAEYTADPAALAEEFALLSGMVK